MKTPFESGREDLSRGAPKLSYPPLDWRQVGAALPKRFEHAPIVLIPPGRAPTLECLEQRFPDAKRIFAVDFYIEGAETGSLLENGAGYQLSERVFNIDHHAPGEMWERFVSSGNLACRWVREDGAVLGSEGDVVVINHTDCDSVIASLIMSGALPPDRLLEEAVIDADHRGAKNDIADMLQSGSESRDLSWLINALSDLLQGLAVDDRMCRRLEALESKRLYVQDLADRGLIVERHGVVFVQCNRQMDSDLFLSVFQEARAVVIGCPCGRAPDIEITRVRLGRAVEEGASLHRLGLRELDPCFGGRFNAGSNKRGLEELMAIGGVVTSVPAEEYFRLLVARLGAPLRMTKVENEARRGS
jgi:hypothetical protein